MMLIDMIWNKICCIFDMQNNMIMATSNKDKENYVKATSEGRLYIETTDFFKIEKVQSMVTNLMQSDIYRQIENRKISNKKAAPAREERPRATKKHNR